jgi:chromosome segregation ATPase
MHIMVPTFACSSEI